MVPVPPESPLPGRRTNIPDETTRLPTRPKNAGTAKAAAKAKGGPKFWTFRYEGDSGPQFGRSELGSEVNVTPFTPIELDAPALVTLQFQHYETLGLQPRIYQLAAADRPFIFDAAGNSEPLLTDTVFAVRDAVDKSDWVPPGISLEETADWGASYLITVNYASIESDLYRLITDAGLRLGVELRWDGGNTWRQYTVQQVQAANDAPIGNHLRIYVTQIDSAGAAPFPAEGENVTIRTAFRNEIVANGHLYFDGPERLVMGLRDANNALMAPWPVPVPGEIRLNWAGGSRTYAVSETSAYGLGGFSPGQTWHEASVELVAQTAPLPADGTPITLTPLAPKEIFPPNARIRARVSYSVGSSDDVVVHCDWRGKLQVMASRISLARVSVPSTRVSQYEPHRVQISAIAMVGGSPPVIPLTLTEPSVLVEPGGQADFLVPADSARVSLLIRWGIDDLGLESAPLGQIFVAFVAEGGGSIGFTDAMVAREALFGEGLPVPAGATRAVISNRNDLHPLYLGVVWHLTV